MWVIFPRVSDLCGAMLSHAEGKTPVTSTLSLDEVAAMLKTTAETVSDCIRHRGLPAAKIGRAWVRVDDDVISWLRQQYPRVDDLAAPAGTAARARRSVAADALDKVLAPKSRAAHGRATP